MAEDTTRYIPKSADSYRGAQVIINSDRLTFNAKNDSILAYSNRDIAFSSQGSIYFDTGTTKEGVNFNKFVVNAPKIYLGLQDEGTDIGKLPVERAVLGNQLRLFLRSLLSVLEDIIGDLADGSFSQISSEQGKPTIGDAAGNKDMEKLRLGQIQDLKNDLSLDDLEILLADPDLCSFLSKRIKLT